MTKPYFILEGHSAEGHWDRFQVSDSQDIIRGKPKTQDPTVGPSNPVSELHPEVLGSTPVQQERTTGSLG